MISLSVLSCRFIRFPRIRLSRAVRPNRIRGSWVTGVRYSFWEVSCWKHRTIAELPASPLWAEGECGLLLLPEACACPVLDQTTGTQSFLANSDLPMARSLVEVLQIT